MAFVVHIYRRLSAHFSGPGKAIGWVCAVLSVHFHATAHSRFYDDALYTNLSFTYLLCEKQFKALRPQCIGITHAYRHIFVSKKYWVCVSVRTITLKLTFKLRIRRSSSSCPWVKSEDRGNDAGQNSRSQTEIGLKWQWRVLP